ncbi:DUF1453 family protein [Kutzneria albida]|uniref:Uncharacterized protein n=1 Tax=Kutzneria albida DSM 43870 TaxID=1449976 RepID=W5WCX5_9PSEU|nr:DUF1453 family protein [Kutzneria albida]AHH98421.1 hypothetical protein KALB_5059 [Kutzneria albida DSM 43870]
MSSPVQIVLVLAAVCYVLVRRMMGEPAEAKRMLVLPAVLGAIGLSQVSADLKSPLSILFLVLTAGISVVIGALRGASVRVSARDGLAFVQYTGVTVALWVANLAVKFGANFVLRAIDPQDAAALGNSLLLTLGAGMLVEGLVVLAKAVRGEGRILWAKGKDGAPHQLSPWLDSLQQNRNGRTAPAGTPHAEYGSDTGPTPSTGTQQQFRR